MTYSVVWTLDAITMLGRLEAEADDLARIRHPAAFVDYALRRVPLDLGESRAGTKRLWYGDVLGVYFDANDNTYAVRVVGIGLARRPR